MNFYHGSKDDNILELTTSHTRDGYVYATSSRLIALTYIARSKPNLFSTFKGQECFFEIKPNLFKEMVRNKSGYIYLLENKDFEPIPQNNKCGHCDCYRIKENVKVVGKEYIKDAYEELKKYIESGDFKILTEDEIPLEQKRKWLSKLRASQNHCPKQQSTIPTPFGIYFKSITKYPIKS